MISISFVFSQCLRHAFFAGAGYKDLDKISVADQNRWVDYSPPTDTAAFHTMRTFIGAHEPKSPDPVKGHVCVAYRQYGRWYMTAPFDNMSKAQSHAKQYLESNEIRHKDTNEILSRNTRAHYEDITYITVQLPE